MLKEYFIGVITLTLFVAVAFGVSHPRLRNAVSFGGGVLLVCGILLPIVDILQNFDVDKSLDDIFDGIDFDATDSAIELAFENGVAEHIGRYDDFARFLASNGFVVCGNDHLGHGKSVEFESELGYVFEGDHANMLRDMNTLHNIMSKRYPDIPYIIFGHSMGSFLARIYTAHFGERLSAAI